MVTGKNPHSGFAGFEPLQISPTALDIYCTPSLPLPLFIPSFCTRPYVRALIVLSLCLGICAVQ